LRNPKGTPIKAADDGVVTFAAYSGTYGNIVKLSHGNGLETWYAHCDTIKVSVGQVVSKGEVIATVGITGRATGYHLHFEVRKNGVPQNPMNYL
jgi:murein DD-endopeptidase MepM/ murein hydrolase activator NlpD